MAVTILSMVPLPARRGYLIPGMTEENGRTPRSVCPRGLTPGPSLHFVERGNPSGVYILPDQAPLSTKWREGPGVRPRRADRSEGHCRMERMDHPAPRPLHWSYLGRVPYTE